MSTLQQLIDNFQKHDYILVSGKAGTGKSYLLQLFKQYLIKLNLNFAITAPTAVAAVNIGGITLHSFLGMGLATESKETLLRKINTKTSARLKRTRVLI